METFDRYIMSANSKGSDQTAELARVAIVCFILFFFYYFWTWFNKDVQQMFAVLMFKLVIQSTTISRNMRYFWVNS